MSKQAQPVLEIKNLNAIFSGHGGRILRDVSLSVIAGDVHGLVGESGAGKSMIGKAIAGLLPSAIKNVSGSIRISGVDLGELPPAERRKFIGKNTAIIPQDPLSALNPSRRIGPQMTDRLIHTLGWSRTKADARILEMLEQVHMPNPERVVRAYPHELSGGMRQRVLIAAAFAAEPKLIIADEPTTALDVTVQKQILRLISEMQEKSQTALLFVTHDMGVVAKICQHVSVLYQGHIAEQCDVEKLFSGNCHPYARELIAATPRYDQPEQSLKPISHSGLEELNAEIAAMDLAWEKSNNG
ncbi:MAG: ABC transporter ATP-binding protein [Rhizobiaceae bacterium]|nr:ABC transporter ATP-binding protein [Rhizobiaceae bacterium]